MKFHVGVEVERVEVADVIVAVEADTIEDARAAALRVLRDMGFDKMAALTKDIEDFEADEFRVRGIADEDYAEGFSADIDLTAAKA